ncbi:hypothetical protein Tco_0353469 [Tanacetum coccineum]
MVVMECHECDKRSNWRQRKCDIQGSFFDGAFGGVRDEEVVVGEGMVVTSSSLDMLTNNYSRGLSDLIFLEEAIDEEALVEFMVE